jgi:HSP20 family protein
MFGLVPRRKDKIGERAVARWEETPLDLLRREFAPLFDRWFGTWPLTPFETEGVYPCGLEMDEKAEAVVIRAAVPGFDPKEIDVRVTGNMLSIHAERKETVEGEKEPTRYELKRSLLLPEGVDHEHVEALYRNGILEVKLPKLPEAKERRIEVKT